MDITRHDAHLRHSRSDDAGTIGADETDILVAFQDRAGFGHVIGRNALGDTDDELDAGRRRFQNGVRREKRGNENEGRVGARFSHRFLDRVENLKTLDLAAALARRHSPDHLGAVIPASLGMEQPRGARDPLADDLSVLIEIDAHDWASFAAATMVLAAESMLE